MSTDYIIGGAGNVNPAIKWQEGAVCFADGEQWFVEHKYLRQGALVTASYEWAHDRGDFQLNTIKQGDYIEASELDEQKYNDAVEVFELFGFEGLYTYDEVSYNTKTYSRLITVDGEVDTCSDTYLGAKRKLTYSQVIAIGELKRLEIERGKVSPTKVYEDWRESQKKAKDVANNQEVKMQKNKPVVAQVMIDLTERMEIGIKTYGEALRANNGRDALQDAYEEALDLACYLKQAMIERDGKEDE